MTHQNPGREVRKVVGLVLGRPIAENENVSRDSEPRWDSLKHVEIMFAVEDAFGARFSEEDLMKLNSTDSIVRALERQNAA